MEPYVGEIRMFPAVRGAPVGWNLCDGSALSISDYQVLYTLIGTMYGNPPNAGSFLLPDLRGRIPIGMGQGTGLTPRLITQMTGTEAVTLTPATMPAHTHSMMASTAQATAVTPANTLSLGATVGEMASIDSPVNGFQTAAGLDPSLIVQLAPNAITAAGSNQPHSNLMPYGCVNYIIALQGLYPSRG